MRPILTMTLLLALGACALTTASRTTQPPVYVVFFTHDSSELEPAAVSVIADVAAAAKAAPTRGVLVSGWTDSAGSKFDDATLSRARAKRVADSLAADGVDTARITQRGRGQTGTDPGVESRRVDISLTN